MTLGWSVAIHLGTMTGRFIDAWNSDRRRVLDFVGFSDGSMIQRGASCAETGPKGYLRVKRLQERRGEQSNTLARCGEWNKET